MHRIVRDYRIRPRLLRSLSLGALALALSAIGFDTLAAGAVSGGPAAIPISEHATATQREVAQITIRAGEAERYYFEPSALELAAGTHEVRFVNEGSKPHTFNIKTQDWDTLYNFDKLDPGAESILQFTLTEPGAYVFYCILYKHVDQGQTGLLTIMP
jgi:plastocyanin